MEDKTVTQLLAEISWQLKPILELSEDITTRADLQTYTEDLYNQLVQLAKECMEFISQLNAGDTINPAWIARRDDILTRAQRLVLDAPDATS